MKRFFNFALVLLTAAGLASCQRFEDEAILPDAYSVIVNTAETRTANEGLNTVWSSGDEMTMFWKSSSGKLHSGKFSYTSGSTFTTTEDVGSSAYRWYGVYPYSDSNTSYTEVSASIPASQTQDRNDSMAHLAGSGFPLWGRTDDYVPSGNTPVFTAHQVATVLKYVVTNTGKTPVTVTKIQFSAPTAIAGACKANLTSENVVWQPSSSNTSQAVTLNVTNGSAINKDENASFFVGAIPFSETGEYTVNVYATDGESNYVYTNKVTGNFVAESGKINTIPLSFVPGDPVTGVTGYELVTSEPSDWSGRYILVSADKKLVFTGDNGTNNKYTLSSTDLSDGIITKDCSAYEFTITKSGSNYYLKNTAKNQYLYCDYSGNRDTGMSYSSSQRALNLKVQDDGTFGFWMREKNTDQYIYYKSSSGSSGSSCFKFGGSHNNHCVYLYKWTEGGTPVDPPTPTTKYYELVTSEPASWDGTYLIVSAASGSAYAFDYSTANGSSASGKAVSISDGKIYSNEDIDACAVKVSKYGESHGSETEHAAYDIIVHGDEYLYRYGTPAKILQSSSYQGNRQNQHTLVYDNGVRMMFSGNQSGSNKYYFHFENDEFTYEGTKNASPDSQYRVFFFKLVDGDQPGKQTQTLSFANSAVEWTLGDTYKVGNSYDAQSVSGVETTVTFTSSNASVATISDGKIKIVAAGETTITATAAEDATYKSATATYKLTIKPAATPSSEKTYKKVTSITEGTYIICGSETAGTYVCLFPPVDATYSDQSKKFDTTNKCKHSLFSSSNTITEIKTSDTSIIGSEVEITASGSSWLIKLKSNGLYMYYNNGKIDFTSTSSSAAQTIGSFSSGKTSMKQGNQLFYHSGTNDGFGYKNRSDVSNLMFFKLDGSSTPDTPIPSTEKTYSKVTSSPSDWSGTYLIVDENSKNVFAYDQSGYKTSVTISSSKIVSEDLSKYEVTISKASGNDATHYVIKTSNGKYLYRSSSSNFLNDSETYDGNRYYAKIGEEGSISLGTKRSDGTEYFFRYSSSAFGFGTDKTATIQLYKLNDGDTPSTPATASFNIENEKLAAYLDAVEASPYFTSNNFGSYSSYYTSSLMKSNQYYNGSSSSNRLDQPVPVVITWSGNATKIEVFTSSSKTSASRVASETFSSSSSASIYNLIPGQKYYYTATNGSTTVATGDFTPTGRRRMIKVSSSFDASHAANCRDFGGLPTVDGKHVKYGLIYRGSNIDGLSSDNDAKDVFLNTMKIKWDIDLRASSEKRSAPTLSGVSKGTQSYSASFDNDNLRSKTKVAKTLKEIIDAINKDTPEPVYIHCRIGSDRTGYICLLVEALIGVTQNYCDTDYEITSFTGSVTGTRFRVDNTKDAGMYKSGIEYLAGFSGTTLHDKVYNFVTSDSGLNISKTDVDKFISRMKE